MKWIRKNKLNKIRIIVKKFKSVFKLLLFDNSISHYQGQNLDIFVFYLCKTHCRELT